MQSFEKDYTPKPLVNREDKNAPVIDMNFNGIHAVIRALKERVAQLSAAGGSLAGEFIRKNFDLVNQQNAAYNIDLYGMASQGHMHKMTITKNLVISSDWCNQMVAPVIDTGITVTVEAGGLWFVDT